MGKRFTPSRELSAILFAYHRVVFQTFHKGEQERQAQYVFVYFYVLCHHHFINFTLQKYKLSSNHTFVQLLDGEYQVPVATPDDVAAVEGEGAELLGVKVFVVLRMRVPTDVVADIHRAVGAVAENQPHLQPAKVNCFRYV